MADREDIRSEMAHARERKMQNRALIHSAFPSMGTAQPSTMGSQSNPPIKTDPYQPDTTTGIPSIDRNSFGNYQ